MEDIGSIVILGNGASLRGFDLHLFQSVSTLGMNAAYRYWERINWYPDYYVCVDDQMIQTHHEAIRELVQKKKVKAALVKAQILDYYPELMDIDSLYFLESFQISLRKKLVEKHQVPKIFSKEFQSCEPSKITTGAYSVRFAAFIGYREITMLGIDLKYQEIIPEAVYRGGSKLEIAETPRKNPNYFFDDYQQKGDQYNIPNPPIYNENLHVNSFKALAKDVTLYNWNAKIYNSNLSSVLHEESIFPFVSIHNFIKNKKNLSSLHPHSRACKVLCKGPPFRSMDSSFMSQKQAMGVSPQKALEIVMGDTRKRNFTLGVCIESSQKVAVEVSFLGCCNSLYEKVSQRVNCSPESLTKLKLSKEFSIVCTWLEVRIDAENLDRETVIDAHSIILLESLGSVRKRLSQTELTLDVANRLMIAQDYLGAFSIYLYLYRNYELSLYLNNALLAARSLIICGTVFNTELLNQCMSILEL